MHYRSDRRAPVSLSSSSFFFAKDTKFEKRRSLILYVQYIHFRFPGLHRRFRQARGDVDIDWLSARFKTGIISTQIWFGTPDGINIFVGNGRWWKVEGARRQQYFAMPGNSIFQRRVDFALKKGEKVLTPYRAHDLHLITTLYVQQNCRR